MTLNHLELNANVAYITECLTSAQAHLAAHQPGSRLLHLGQGAPVYSQYFDMVSGSLSGCIKASRDEKSAKLQIFAFLLAKHFRSDVPLLSLDLILDLVIWHQFTELFEVSHLMRMSFHLAC